MHSNFEYGNHIMESFEFESGRVLENVKVEYETRGIPSYDDDGNITNAVVYCPTLKGGLSILAQHHDFIYDNDESSYFFIKITSLGAPDSCSPSTTGLRYGFPTYTIKDSVNFKRQFLAEKFNIRNLLGLVGEGTGGFEVYTWACEYPDEMEFIIVLNSTYKTYGSRYVQVKIAESIVESSDDFYADGYEVSLTKLIVAITKLMFLCNYSSSLLEEFSNDELDVMMEDYVDEGLFMDIHDFKSRNDCLLAYDVSDKLHNIKAKSLIIGISNNPSFNNKKDVLPLKDKIKDLKIVTDIKSEESIFGESDYSELGSEIKSFLNEFKR